MKNSVFCLLVSVVCLFFLSNTGYACTCAPKASVGQELEQSTAVFSGRVVAIRKHEQTNDPFAVVEVVFEVAKTWKGVNKQTVSVFTGSHSATCAFKFKKGQSYLVYANSDSRERLVTGICSRTRKLKEAREDLDDIVSSPAFN